MATMSLERKPTLTERLKARIREVPGNLRTARAKAEEKYEKSLITYEKLLNEAEKQKKAAKKEQSRLSVLVNRTKNVLARKERKRRTRARKTKR